MRLAALLACLIVSSALAQSLRPLREARSENGRFYLRVERVDPRRAADQQHARDAAPDRPAPRDEDADSDAAPPEEPSDSAETEADHPQQRRIEPAQNGAEARLVERVRGADEHEIWSARLVNPVAPLRALIHDDGSWVVTLDDYPDGGARHALVIYDAHGRATRALELPELLSKADRAHVRQRGSRVEWMSGSRARFLDDDRFELRLRWGSKLTIDLRDGRIDRTHSEARDDDGDALSDAAGAEDAEVIEGFDVPELALEAGEEALRARLAELLARTSSASDPAELDAAMHEAAALRAALEALDASRSFGPAEFLTEPDAGESDAAPQPRADAAPPDGPKQPQPDEHPGAAGNSAQAGIPVPMPDLQQRFDYVAWLNRVSTPASGDLTAQVALDRAAKGLVEYTGDSELFDRAMEGDAGALAAPEIRAWVEANRGTIDALALARAHEYRGMPMASEDGSMIGILLPNLAPWRQGIKATVLDGKILEAEGRPGDAAQRYIGAMASGAQFSQGPTLIENLVGIASQSLGQSALLDAYAGSDAFDYAALAAQMDAQVGSTRPIAETFQNERAMVLDAIQRTFQYDPDTQSSTVDAAHLATLMSVAGEPDGAGGFDRILTGIALQNAGFEATVSGANTHYDRLTSAAQLPFMEAQAAFGEFEREITSPSFKLENPLLGALLPSLSRASFLATRNEAATRAARLITELKAQQQSTGSLPESLDALRDRSYTIDPFTGQAFGFRREGNDFVIYSKGANGIDDGGLHDRSGESNDILYWPRPPKPGPR